MSASDLGRRIGNIIYRHAFGLYRPLYGAFKTYQDRTERRLLADNLSPGDVVVDAGANIGIYAHFLAQQVGSNGVVHAFEPSPENFARLRQTVAGLANVRANQMAVSDSTGESLLHISDQLNVDHRAYPTAGENRRAVTIRSTQLDDYFKASGRVDLIKMDIQGFELHALRGTARVLEDNPNIALLLEFWPYGLKQAGETAAAFLSFLTEREFVLSVPGEGAIDPGHLLRIDASDPGRYLNLFAKRSPISK